MSVQADIIALHARLTPNRLAARDLAQERRWNYAGLDQLVGCLAAGLLAHGCRAGDRIALIAGNSVEFVALHFACGRVGAILVPLNWRLSKVELAALLDRAEPSLFLSDGSAEAPEGRWPAQPLDAFVAEAEVLAPHRAGLPDQSRPSLILFTSGTSGRPKGVVLTERNLLESAINFVALTKVGRESVFLCEAPMFHVLGAVANVRAPLLVGGAIVVGRGFEPARTLARLGDPDLGITHYCGVPQMMEALRAVPGFEVAPLRRMTALVTGGAPHSPADLAAWLEDGVAMTSGFGMSETGTVFGMPADAAAIRTKPGSVGVGAPWIEARIVGGEGQVCAPGESGELQLRGPNVTPGYWRDPEESARAIDAEGWFATGDVARADEDGFHWIIDRKKDMFISGGENVYPAEVEALLAGYPGIAECAMVGVPDARWGEAGHLAIVPEAEGSVTTDALLGFLGERLARYKLPKQVRFVDRLPRTATGKLQKSVLREQLIAAP